MFWCPEHRKKSFFTRRTRPYADIWQIRRFHIVKMKKIQKYEYKCEAIALNMKKMGRVLLGMIDTVCENVV